MRSTRVKSLLPFAEIERKRVAEVHANCPFLLCPARYRLYPNGWLFPMAKELSQDRAALRRRGYTFENKHWKPTRVQLELVL